MCTTIRPSLPLLRLSGFLRMLGTGKTETKEERVDGVDVEEVAVAVVEGWRSDSCGRWRASTLLVATAPGSMRLRVTSWLRTMGLYRQAGRRLSSGGCSG